MSIILELAAGNTATAALGAGVNEALAVEGKDVFEIKESVATIRKYASRVESTKESTLEIEKYSGITMSDGADLEDGTDATWTVVDNAALLSFGASTNAVSVGFQLTPKLVRQARQEPAAFLARYRQKIAFDLARREDVYLMGVLEAGAGATFYPAGVTTDAGVGTGLNIGDVMVIESFEAMVDDMKEKEYEPTDFISTSKIVGQLRRDARLLNSSDFSVAIKEDGSTVTQIGSVMLQEIKGTVIIPDFAGETGNCTFGIMVDKSSAYAIVDFLKSDGASPVTISTGQPDPTLAGANFHRILGQMELEAQVLDTNAVSMVRVAKI